MAGEDSTASLLSTLQNALGTAGSALSSEPQQFPSLADGISLLDVKNELILSYLQNLVFLIILKLRLGAGDDERPDLKSEVTKKLVELRVFLERGLRPLESKLKYQIDKVVKAAEEADRRAAQNLGREQAVPHRSRDGTTQDHTSEEESADSDSSEEGLNGSGDVANYLTAETSHRPRPALLAKSSTAAKGHAADAPVSHSTPTGTYKPPRITPTAMPEPPSQRQAVIRKRKSHLLDEYIDEELSSAPRAQPSIGSNRTILHHGRSTLSARDREKERERTEYEERNFVRLPAESKAERRQARLRGERDKRDMFGGEDWTGLGGLGDRVSRSVANSKIRSVLERREKRQATEDLPRGDGVGIGDTFEKRRKVLQQRAEKKVRRPR